VFTGLLPFVSRRVFEAVTGRSANGDSCRPSVAS
jgi:hypothetical protein